MSTDFYCVMNWCDSLVYFKVGKLEQMDRCALKAARSEKALDRLAKSLAMQNAKLRYCDGMISRLRISRCSSIFRGRKSEKCAWIFFNGQYFTSNEHTGEQMIYLCELPPLIIAGRNFRSGSPEHLTPSHWAHGLEADLVNKWEYHMRRKRDSKRCNGNWIPDLQSWKRTTC